MKFVEPSFLPAWCQPTIHLNVVTMPVSSVAIQSSRITANSLRGSQSIWQVNRPFRKCRACSQTRRRCSVSGAVDLAAKGPPASMLVSLEPWTYSAFLRCRGSAGRSQALSPWQRTWEQRTTIPAYASITTVLCMNSIAWQYPCMSTTPLWIYSRPSSRRWMRSFLAGENRISEHHRMPKER